MNDKCVGPIAEFIWNIFPDLRRYTMMAIISMGSLYVKAQAPAQQVTCASGGYYLNSNGSVSYTVGDIVIQTNSSSANIVTQGFQQSFIINPLPINLLSFTAALVNGETHLQWISSNEVNLDYYEVERSINSQGFLKLFEIKPEISSGTKNIYNTVDYLPSAGIDYYRLKEVDKDGKFNYSGIVFVNMLENFDTKIYPIPCSDYLTIGLNSNIEKEMTFCIYDMNGKLLLTKNILVFSGSNSFVLDIHSLMNGTYILKSMGGSGPSKVLKFVKI